ncbi:VOC family protein [Kitasatospora sp. NPDC088391]|uniref:VOC family protein n=1 Tax=Kitasatospora sp. NPDC088391 TaxID=3364074 RepID=UPI00382EBEE9
MQLVSVRLITADVDRLVAFYQHATGLTADHPTPDFAELRTPTGTLAIGSVRTVPLFAPGAAEPAANRSAIVEFLVEDVDLLAARLTAAGVTPVSGPATLPWGNRSLLVRDPDGTLVNFFAPATPAARARLAR